MPVVIKNLEFYDLVGSIAAGTAKQRKRMFILTTASATAVTNSVYLPTYDPSVSSVDLAWAADNNVTTSSFNTYAVTFGSGSVQAGTAGAATICGVVTLT